MSVKKKLSELRYGGTVIALADSPVDAFIEKCQMILDKSVQYSEELKVYFDDNQWVFDYLPNKKQASRHLASWLLWRDAMPFVGGVK